MKLEALRDFIQDNRSYWAQHGYDRNGDGAFTEKDVPIDRYSQEPYELLIGKAGKALLINSVYLHHTLATLNEAGAAFELGVDGITGSRARKQKGETQDQDNRALAAAMEAYRRMSADVRSDSSQAIAGLTVAIGASDAGTVAVVAEVSEATGSNFVPPLRLTVPELEAVFGQLDRLAIPAPRKAALAAGLEAYLLDPQANQAAYREACIAHSARWLIDGAGLGDTFFSSHGLLSLAQFTADGQLRLPDIPTPGRDLPEWLRTGFKTLGGQYREAAANGDINQALVETTAGDFEHLVNLNVAMVFYDGREGLSGVANALGLLTFREEKSAQNQVKLASFNLLFRALRYQEQTGVFQIEPNELENVLQTLASGVRTSQIPESDAAGIREWLAALSILDGFAYYMRTSSLAASGGNMWGQPAFDRMSEHLAAIYGDDHRFRPALESYALEPLLAHVRGLGIDVDSGSRGDLRAMGAEGRDSVLLAEVRTGFAEIKGALAETEERLSQAIASLESGSERTVSSNSLLKAVGKSGKTMAHEASGLAEQLPHLQVLVVGDGAESPAKALAKPLAAAVQDGVCQELAGLVEDQSQRLLQQMQASAQADAQVYGPSFLDHVEVESRMRTLLARVPREVFTAIETGIPIAAKGRDLFGELQAFNQKVFDFARRLPELGLDDPNVGSEIAVLQTELGQLKQNYPKIAESPALQAYLDGVDRVLGLLQATSEVVIGFDALVSSAKDYGTAWKEGVIRFTDNIQSPTALLEAWDLTYKAVLAAQGPFLRDLDALSLALQDLAEKLPQKTRLYEELSVLVHDLKELVAKVQANAERLKAEKIDPYYRKVVGLSQVRAGVSVPMNRFGDVYWHSSWSYPLLTRPEMQLLARAEAGGTEQDLVSRYGLGIGVGRDLPFTLFGSRLGIEVYTGVEADMTRDGWNSRSALVLRRGSFGLFGGVAVPLSSQVPAQATLGLEWRN